MVINQPESVTETSNSAAVPTFGNNNCIFDILISFWSSLESAQLVRSVKATTVHFSSLYLHYTKFRIILDNCNTKQN